MHGRLPTDDLRYDLLTQYFLYDGGTKEHRAFLHDVLDLGLAFLDGSVRRKRVLRYRTLDTLKEIFDQPLPQSGTDLPDLLNALRRDVASLSIAQSDQRYLAFPDTGNSVATVAADVLVSLLNQNLIAVDRSAPSGTFLEIQLLLWLRELVGYTHARLDSSFTLADVGGMWTSGGNMSNHIAVLAAMQNRWPEVRSCGLLGLKSRPAMILAKGIEHFSFPCAAQVLGIGLDNVLWAAPKADYTTDPDSVADAIEGASPEQEPFVIISVAGNCRTTNLDDIRRLRKVCDDYGLWLHVDACHGGSLLFSQRLRRHLAGIEMADSISLDPHKGLFVSYPSSYVLFRNPRSLGVFARYPDKFTDPRCLDIGLIMPFFGSRGLHSLKLWLLIKHLGVDGISAAVESREEVNQSLTRDLQDTELFVFFNDNAFYRLAFVFCPNEVQRILQTDGRRAHPDDVLRDMVSRHTANFCERLYKRGTVIFDLFSLPDLNNRLGLGSRERYATMAFVAGHPVLDAACRERILAEVRDVGRACTDEFLNDLQADAERSRPGRTDDTTSPASW